MPDINLQHIAAGLALFFISIAVYKALSQRAGKRAAAARSIAQSQEGQAPTVSLHNPYSSDEPLPKAPGTDAGPPPSAPSAKPAAAPVPSVAQAQSGNRPQAEAAAASPKASEQIYKWN